MEFCFLLINDPSTELISNVIDVLKENSVKIQDTIFDRYIPYFSNYSMDNCEDNMLITEYAGITDQID